MASASSEPQSVARSFLERLARESQNDHDLEVLWATSNRPGPLEALGSRVRSLTPAQLLEAAQESANQGRYPLMVLSSRSLPQIFPALLHGLPHEGTFVLLGGGLTFSMRESFLHPGRLRDLALLRMVSGLAVAAPADEEDASQLFQMARRTETPLAIRFTSAPWVPVKRDYASVPPGCALKVRDGQHISILALGSTVLPSLLAAEALSTWGFETNVYAMRFVRPLDMKAVREALHYQPVLTVEEHCLQGGLHTAVLEGIHQTPEFSTRPVQVTGLGLRGHPVIEVGSTAEQFALHAEGIKKACLQLLGAPDSPWPGEGVAD